MEPMQNRLTMLRTKVHRKETKNNNRPRTIRKGKIMQRLPT